MQRVREDFQEYLYNTCLKYTVKENRPLTEEETRSINNCYSKMAKSYRVIQDLHVNLTGDRQFNRKLFK